jgi:MFS family permease
VVALDAGRFAVVLLLPFVDRIWQVYALIFLLQSCSAAFTPTFTATIPDVLPREADYTKALSLSRLAYDLESLLSPALAAALLLTVSFHGLFFGTAVGFLGSTLLVVSVALPYAKPVAPPTSVSQRLTRGLHIYLATPRLRGLLCASLAAAAGGAMVIVNTVVIVRDGLGRPDSAVAIALAAFGAGSVMVALALPRWLDRRSDRSVMLTASTLMTFTLLVLAVVWPLVSHQVMWVVLLITWVVLGAAYSGLVTPGGRLLRRSSRESERPALFAAQFSLSHACWLLAYPLAGWLGAGAGIGAALWAVAALAALGTIAAQRVWPRDDPETLPHQHHDLPSEHPHLAQYGSADMHRHAFVIDELHGDWPAR